MPFAPHSTPPPFSAPAGSRYLLAGVLARKLQGLWITVPGRSDRRGRGADWARAGVRRGGHRVGVRGERFGAAAGGEGVPGRRTRGGAALRRRRVRGDLLGAAALPLGAPARVLRHPADEPAA